MKKKLVLTFWTLYMLFFAIPFPMILYYGINSEFDISTLKTKDPYWALGFLLLSVLLWAIILIGYFRKWIVQIFLTQNNLKKIKRNGLRREAEIISSKKTSKPYSKFNTYEAELCFKNLADTEIIHKTTITDIKPLERHFETGNKIGLLLDRNMKNPPYIYISSASSTLNTRTLVLRVLGWLLFTGLVLGYYFYSYNSESYGMGWRFMSAGHPLIVIPLVLLFYRILVRFIFKKLSGLDQDSVVLKFKGIKATAKVSNVSQTGAFINAQPVMRFEVEYKDVNNQTYKASLKKVVSILELEMTQKQFLDIFYDPENPDHIVFATDLNKI